MAGSLNKVMLIGNLGADPEIRSLTNGNSVASFSMATTETWKDRNTGERKEKTEWHRVTVFTEGLVKIVENYVKKGSKLYVEGQLQTRKWQDQEGNDRYTTEIVLSGFGGTLTMLDGNRDGGGNSGGGNSGDERGGSRGSSGGDHRGEDNRDRGRQDNRGNFSRDLDDDIPF